LWVWLYPTARASAVIVATTAAETAPVPPKTSPPARVVAWPVLPGSDYPLTGLVRERHGKPRAAAKVASASPADMTWVATNRSENASTVTAAPEAAVRLPTSKIAVS